MQSMASCLSVNHAIANIVVADVVGPQNGATEVAYTFIASASGGQPPVALLGVCACVCVCSYKISRRLKVDTFTGNWVICVYMWGSKWGMQLGLLCG